MAKNAEIKTADEEVIREKVIQISRVTKVVKGGKNMSFRVTVVVGDGKGRVGLGIGKSEEVPTAIRKGIQEARKDQILINLTGSTIPHVIYGKSGASRVILRPAIPGTGVIAGGAVRSILEMLGVSDIVAKAQGSRNPINIARATLDGLSKLMTVDAVAKTRGVKLSVQKFN